MLSVWPSAGQLPGVATVAVSTGTGDPGLGPAGSTHGISIVGSAGSPEEVGGFGSQSMGLGLCGGSLFTSLASLAGPTVPKEELGMAGPSAGHPS